MQTPLDPDRQEAYYAWQDKMEKEDDAARRRLANAGQNSSSEETRESIYGDLYPNLEPGEEIPYDDPE